MSTNKEPRAAGPYSTFEYWATELRVGDRMHWAGQGLMTITHIRRVGPGLLSRREFVPAELNERDEYVRVTGILNERRMVVDLETDDVVTFDRDGEPEPEGLEPLPRSVAPSPLGTTREDWAQRMLAQIRRMQVVGYWGAKGWVNLPGDITDFGDLHDHFDANVGWGEDIDNLPQAEWAALQERVDELLKAEAEAVRK